MVYIRDIIGARFMAGVPAAAVVYLVLVQSLVTAYAQGATAASEMGPKFVICSPLGTTGDDGNPLKELAHECCSTLCRSACAVGSSLAPAAEFVSLDKPCSDKWLVYPAARAPPFESALIPEARGPPLFSI